VALITTDVLGKHIASIISARRIGELGTTLATLRSVLLLLVTVNFVPSLSNLVTLMMDAMRSSKTTVLTRVTRHHVPEDTILHCHRRENLKSYIALTGWAL
jgi:hypothetical protein